MSGTERTLRVAMVDAGGFAARHLEVPRHEPGVEVVGHVSRTLAPAEAQARRYGGGAVVTHAVADRRERPRFPDADVAEVSAATLRFGGGAFGGVFTATFLLGASARVELQLMRDDELITVTQESVVYDDGRDRREVRVNGDPVVVEARAFLESVRSGDGSVLLCGYADAARTDALTHEVVAAAG